MGRVKVYCRLRPAKAREAGPETDEAASFRDVTGADAGADDSCCPAGEWGAKTLTFQRDSGERKQFEFDAFFRPDTSQERVYETAAENIVADVLEGYNGALMAYGQTGTGKTHTMIGTPEARGVLPRALQDLFARAPADAVLSLSYVQIYCEVLLDLLGAPEAQQQQQLSIRDDSRVDGAQERQVRSAEDCLRLLAEGDARRVVAETAMNAHSSRSHAVCMVRVERRTTDGQLLTGTLTLVDLAGSERVKKSHVRHVHLTELRAINLSLSALGNCVAALAEKRAHVPFRDSKLTRLLRASLAGNAKTALIVTLGPEMEDSSESHASLLFGQRAMNVPVEALPNLTRDYRELYEALQARVDAKDDRLHQTEISLGQVKQQEAELRARVDAAEHAAEAAQAQLAQERASHEATLEALTRSAGGDVGALSEASARFEAETAAVRAETEKQVAEMRAKCARQIASYKAAASEAGEEWNNIEYELEHERTGHLETLRELREAKEALRRAEDARAERVAELTEEQEELSQSARRALETLEDLRRQLAARDKQLEAASRRSEAVIQERDAARKEAATNAMLPPELAGVDYVSREQVAEMQKLYGEHIDRLVARVEQLESTDKVAAITAGTSSALHRKFAGLPSRRSSTGSRNQREEDAPSRGRSSQPQSQPQQGRSRSTSMSSRLSRLAQPRRTAEKRRNTRPAVPAQRAAAKKKESFRERFAHRRNVVFS